MRMSKWITVIWLAASVLVLAADSPAPKPAAEAQDAAVSAGQKKTAAAKQDSEAGTEPKVASKPRKRSLKHQRDPFVSPIVKRKSGGVKCTGTGRQCLFAGDLVLQGIVKHAGGYIAVVASGQHTYFLRDEDPLADGKVERISRDSIVLQQRSTDVFGRPVERKITKKLNNPAV
jgi:Tfp pilus assembly protein PilP